MDIGCGGGANIKRLLECNRKGKVMGVDYSVVSVEKSRKVNADAIAAGRCCVLEASVDALPFKDATFRMVTAFETVYFWPDIVKCFTEVKRVMEPGGKLLIVNEDDGLSGAEREMGEADRGYAHLYSR